MNSVLHLVDPSIANALGWTIIHSFWQASLVALLMSLVHRYGKQKSASFKYGVSVLSMISVFVISTITFSIYYSTSTAPIEILASVDMGQMMMSEDTELSMLNSFQVFFTQNIDNINLIWAVGVILFLMRFILSYAYTKYLKKTAIFSNETNLERTLARIKNNLLIDKTIAIAESAKINVPLVVGHLKPIILFPVGIINQLNLEEVEAIITHELAHIKRYDYLTNILLTLIEILFYFHPAIWWISANVKAERENCCDDFALSQNIDKVVYAKALVKLEEIKSMGAPALAIPFSSNKHQLINRIKRIMNMPQTQSDIKEKSIATILLLSIVLLFSNQANSESILSDSFVESKESEDTSRLVGNDEMVLRVKDGKFESLTIDNETQESEFVDQIASSMDRNATDNDSYTVTIKESPVLELKDSRIHISGQGGVIYESDDLDPKLLSDTIPLKRKNSSKIITQNNGKTIEIEKENGEITSLKIDGKVIPERDYREYEEEIESTEGIYDFDEENEIFERFNDQDFSKSFGLLFDGEKWREFGGNMNQLFDGDMLKKLQDMEGMRFDFKYLEDMDELKGLEKLHELRGLEKLHELEGFENMSELENLSELFEELGINLDSTFSNMNFNFDNLDGFDFLNEFDFDDEDVTIFRGNGSNQGRGTVVDKIGRMLNKDGLLKEYKSNKVEITGKHLKINGEKMPKALFEKYKNIYQESTGAPLTKKSKMVFDVEGKPSKRKVKSY